MGKKKIAKTFIPIHDLDKLQNHKYLSVLLESASHPYKLSDNVKDNGALDWKQVYKKIIDGEFFIAKPEKSKASGAKASVC